MSMHQLQEELNSVRTASRQLSKAIGAAKKAGEHTQALVEQKKAYSLRERELAAQLAEILTDAGQTAESNTTGPAEPAVQPPQLLPPRNEALPQAPADPAPIETTLATSADWAQWDAFVGAHAAASVYHLSGWREVIQTSFGHDCPYLIARRSGEVVGVMPLVRIKSRLFGHFMVSLPYFNYGGPLSNDFEADQALVLEAIHQAKTRQCQHIEWRESALRPGMPARTEKVNMWLKLPANAADLWQAIGSKLRAQIKKAQASGLTYETGGLDLLEDFYRVFSINMRDLGTPVYSKGFFETVLRQAPGQPVLVVGRTGNGQAVSAALLLKHGTRMEVPWASTLRRANPLNANMGLYWQLLSHACEARCTIFDFGRSTRDAATYRFKKQWGASPVESFWNYWLQEAASMPKLNPSNSKFHLAIEAWKTLPTILTNSIGPTIAKQIP